MTVLTRLHVLLREPGDFARAREFIDSITDPQVKDDRLDSIARTLAMDGDFAEAREFIDLITDTR
jgi:hypothetical protein